jgi:predicted acetyltransferase
MPQFIEPDSSVQESFLAAVAEFEAEGATNLATVGWRDRWSATWGSAAGFADFVAALRADALPETPRADDWVPCTTLWWVDGDTYLGRLSIRHELKGWLADYGGHIGYDVRPSARRHGHATAMLRAALPVAAGLGIDRALLSCDADNIASRRVIEVNGGVPDGVREGKLRFWIDLA